MVQCLKMSENLLSLLEASEFFQFLFKALRLGKAAGAVASASALVAYLVKDVAKELITAVRHQLGKPWWLCGPG